MAIIARCTNICTLTRERGREVSDKSENSGSTSGFRRRPRTPEAIGTPRGERNGPWPPQKNGTRTPAARAGAAPAMPDKPAAAVPRRHPKTTSPAGIPAPEAPELKAPAEAEASCRRLDAAVQKGHEARRPMEKATEQAPEAPTKFAAPAAGAGAAREAGRHRAEEAAAWAHAIPEQVRPPPPGRSRKQARNIEGRKQTENVAVSTVE